MNQVQLIRGLAVSSLNGGTPEFCFHKTLSVAAVFLSDIHLGFKGCKAKELVAFLNHICPECIYLVGDFFDGWNLSVRHIRHIGRLFEGKSESPAFRLPFGQGDVIRKLLRHQRRGTRIFYIPGNHDGLFRPGLSSMPDVPQNAINRFLVRAESAKEPGREKDRPDGQDDYNSLLTDYFDAIPRLGHITVLPQAVHETRDRQRFIVQHGDEFDFLVRNWRLLGVLGTRVKDRLFALHEWLAHHDDSWLIRQISRDFLGLGKRFSLARYLEQIKTSADLVLPELANRYVKARNENILKRRREKRGWEDEPLFAGIITGHNHIVESLNHNGIAYYNCGSWVKNGRANCTAVVEHLDGRMELVRWDNERGIVPYPPCFDQEQAHI